MRRLPAAGIRFAIPIVLLSVTWATGTCGTFYPLRNPQVAFNSASLQAFLDERDGGIQASTDQLDAQVISFAGISANFSVECLLGSGLEFGVYDPNLGESTIRCPIFTAASAPRGWAQCSLVADSTLIVVEFDSLFNFVRTASFPWAAHMNFGFYVSGPGGTWYSQDDRNAGAPHALTYAATGALIGTLFECLEPGAFDPAAPGAFSGLVVAIGSSICPPTPSSRAGRAFDTDCTPAVTSTWGALKAIYR